LCAANTEPIGTGDEPVRALAFGGGGFDTVMQLGVAHAMLVSDAQAPDVIVGISAGALSAAAVAEILKADEQLPQTPATEPLRRAARMSRFREFLYETQELPERVIESLPDPFEADAGRPLAPQQQAGHQRAEREMRRRALRAKSGLVELFNTAAGLRLEVATLTRALRVYLGLQAARELTGLRKAWVWAIECGRALRTVAAAPLATAQLLHALGSALAGGIVRHHMQRLEDRGKALPRQLQQLLTFLEKKSRTAGYTAGEIIFRGEAIRRILDVAAALILTPTLWFILRDNPKALRLLREAGKWLLGMTTTTTFRGAMGIAFATLLVSIITILVNRHLRRAVFHWARNRVLENFDLLTDLGNEHVLKELLVRLFDPEYYGSATLRPVLRTALAGAPPTATTATPRRLDTYLTGQRKIHVVPIAAALSDGTLRPLDPQRAIVDGLLAANAVLPFFRALPHADDYQVDGINISNEPTTAVRQLLRDRIHPHAPAAYIYPVSSLPIENNQIPAHDRDTQADSTDSTPSSSRRYVSLINVVYRVLQLQQFRHAKLERQLTRLYRSMLPPRSTAPERFVDGKLRALKCFTDAHYVRAEIFPIEPTDHPVTLTERLFQTSKKLERQTAIADTIADGCRLTLQALMPTAVQTAWRAEGERAPLCQAALEARLRKHIPDLPGAPEICGRCALQREDGVAVPGSERRLREVHPNPAAPEWPTDQRYTAAVLPSPVVVSEPPPVLPDVMIGPATINLLFSGGVFRGVFLVGAINALNELRLRPTLLAGSSVGSITAAMAGRIFASALPLERHLHIALLAGTFLGIDQLVITDRFADFIRRLTLRAAEAKFSLRDVDRFLRNYDRSSNRDAIRSARRVAGGLEHLCYISPFELLDLVRALRLQDTRTAYRLGRRYFQELLDRGGVSLEVLGTEPLRFLIKQHVLTSAQQAQRTVPFAPFPRPDDPEHPINFLVTATNLTGGYLEIIGLPKKGSSRASDATLVDSLLASSAFPGVFRPRFGWEVFVGEEHQEQFVDGGVMDNLPLDAVVDYLHAQALAGNVPARPPNRIPHLLFTASLEPEFERLGPATLRERATNWPSALRRARELRFNRKVEGFRHAQDEFRDIYNRYGAHRVKLPWSPLDIAVVVVEPQWLCSTFGFHPMLGFSRRRQAASIAHGCASTLARFAAADQGNRSWTLGWGIPEDRLTDLDHDRLQRREPVARDDGWCHFRRSTECPFSPGAIRRALRDATGLLPVEDGKLADEIGIIYDECGKASSHRREV
jgi:predicted acylesterase/phospholipase RssA